MKTNQRLIDQRETKSKSNVEHTVPGKQMFDDINDLQDRIQKLEEVVNNIIDVINQLKVV